MKVLSSIILKETEHVVLKRTMYTDNNENSAHWDWIARKNSQKAVVIACLLDDKLVVIKEFRVPIEGYEYGLPAGLIDEGETVEDAVRRELEEETGLTVTEIMDISPAVLSSVGLTNEEIHIAYVKATGVPNKEKLEASEDIDTYLLDREQVKDLMKRGDIHIGKTAYSTMRSFVKFGEI